MLPLRAAFAAARHAAGHSPIRAARLLATAGGIPPPLPPPHHPIPHARAPVTPPSRALTMYRKRYIAGMLSATSAGMMASAVLTPAPVIPSFFVERHGLLMGVGAAPHDASVSLEMAAATHCIPHPSKRNKPGGSGEDAYFVSRNGEMLGVADGVGGWATWGVDPALYAKALMSNALKAADANPELSPLEVLQRAYDATAVSKIVGTATACVASIKGTTVRVANLGDSGAMLVRDGIVAHRTREQQHSFNCPFQLGTDSNDRPEHAELYEWPGLQRGDVLILGTDGLWDNMFDDVIAAEVASHVASSKGPGNGTQICTDLAQRIARRAFQMASSPTSRTPFWSKAGGPRGQGGKLDDITVLVAIAGSVSPPDSPRREPTP